MKPKKYGHLWFRNHFTIPLKKFRPCETTQRNQKKQTNKKNKQTHTQNPVKLKINYLLKNVVVKIWDSNITYLSKVAQTLRTQFSCENESFEKLTAGMKYTPFLDKKAKSNTQK